MHDCSECTGVLKQTSISQETGDFAVQIICSPHPTEKKAWIDKILTQHITFPNDKIRMDAVFKELWTHE